VFDDAVLGRNDGFLHSIVSFCSVVLVFFRPMNTMPKPRIVEDCRLHEN